MPNTFYPLSLARSLVHIGRTLITRSSGDRCGGVRVRVTGQERRAAPLADVVHRSPRNNALGYLPNAPLPAFKFYLPARGRRKRSVRQQWFRVIAYTTARQIVKFVRGSHKDRRENFRNSSTCSIRDLSGRIRIMLTLKILTLIQNFVEQKVM